MLLSESKKIVAIETNKKNQDVIVVQQINSKNVDIELHRLEYMYGRSQPRINACIETNYETGKQNLYIEDILARGEDVGNGSIMIKYLIQLANVQELQYIRENLSKVDVGNFDKLEYFYI